MEKDKLSKAAKSLSKLGASKGGKKRAENLSPQERSEIARRAVMTRWNKQLGNENLSDDTPWAVAEGALNVFNHEIPCAVLENGIRVLTQAGVMTAIGRAKKAKGGQGYSKEGLPPFLQASNLRPFITDELINITKPIIYKPLTGGYSEAGKYRTIAFGCRAEALSAICRVYVDADNARKLIATQRHIADAARRLLVALEDVAIIALVDEATDFQAIRPHNELQRILEAYVRPEHIPWIRTVPIEFTKQLYRLWGWDLKSSNMQGPRYAGKLIRKYIYEQLPDGVLEELDRINPANSKWQRRRKHFQHLTDDTGIQHFRTQLASVMTLMRASTTKREFEKLFERVYGEAIQLEFELDDILDTNQNIKLLDTKTSTTK